MADHSALMAAWRSPPSLAHRLPPDAEGQA